MAGTSIMTRICTFPYPFPHPIEKLGDSLYQSMRGFSIKTETGLGNTHGSGFICHL